MNAPRPGTELPKWLLYGLVGKAVLVAAIVAGIVIYVNFA